MATRLGLKEIRLLKEKHQIELKKLTDDVYRTRKNSTVFNFKTFNNSIKHDLTQALEIFFSQERKTAYRTGKHFDELTDNAFFRVERACIRTAIHIMPSFTRFDKYDCDYTRLVTEGHDSLQIGALSHYHGAKLHLDESVYEKRYNNIGEFIYNYVIDKKLYSYNGSDISLYDGRYSYTFLKKALISSDLKSVLNNHLCLNDCMPAFVELNVESGFEYDADEKKISYMKAGRKVDMRVGKGIRKLLKKYDVPFTDEHIKNIVNDLDVTTDDYEFRVVDGDEIEKYYLGTQYETNPIVNTGSLANSCMRYSGCSDYFQPYKDNARMLILVHPETDLIIGRALLWQDVTVVSDNHYDEDDDRESYEDQEIMYMDRIYANESVYPKFKQWAKDNDYFRRRYQSYSSPEQITDLNGVEQQLGLELPFSMADYDEVPFCDTFAWCDEYTTQNDQCFGHYTAQDTDGNLGGRDNDDYDDDDY